MALMAGELNAMLDLDAGPFDSSLEKAMGALGDKGKWNAAAATAGVAAGAALGAGLVSAVSFDGAERKMNAALGLTEDQAEAAGEAAGNLYAGAWGDSMEDVTGATEAVMSSIPGMMDAPAASIEDLTAKVLDMAEAFEVDAGRAAQVAGQMITTGLAKDGTEAADLLGAAMQRVPKELREDILDATDEYGPFFEQIGISGEKAMGMLVDSSAKGMFGIDKTGDAVKEFATLVTTDMARTKEPIEALGLDYEKVSNDMLAGGDKAADATQQIIDGLLGMGDPAEQARAAVELFGTPIEDLSSKDIPKFLESLSTAEGGLGDFSGTMSEVGDELNGGPGVALLEFKRMAETAFADMAGTILPFLTPIIQKLSEWAPILGPIAVGIGALAAAIWVVQAAIAAWNVIQLIMNATLWASPITWIIAVVIALIAVIWLIVANWDEISAWLMAAGATFLSWWTGFMAAIGQWAIDVWNGFVGWIKGLWSGFVGWLFGIGASIASWWSGLWTTVGALVKVAWQLIKQWIMQAFLNVLRFIITTGTDIRSFLSDTWSNVTSGISGFVDNVLGFFRDLPGNILAALGNLGSLLVNAGDQILQGFLDGLRAGFNAVKDFVGGIGSWIADNKGPKAYDLALLVPAGGWIMDGLEDGIRSSMPGLQAALGDVTGLVEAGVDPTLAFDQHFGAAPVELSAYDRALLREAGTRPVSVQVDRKEIALATRKGERDLTRR
ncbi:hypothetical protein [Zhihengliuella halotolerans]|uniref:hypothetical protein n=1 Tax=Zhihengliuella halotolerans TaxID=370736 RepID=UPI000C80C5D2|nr:hypothetical protein [Zhihengliuella halotolerans]